MDPHKNIFYYYRGPSIKKNEFDNQIENNATKSLINILEFSTKLNIFDITNCFFKIIGILPKSNKMSFELQYKGSESIPDGIIKLEDKIILIEVKINAPWNQSQIMNHISELNDTDLLLLIGKTSPGFELTKNSKYLSWKRIYSEFKKLNLQSTIMQELLNQFLEYLELIQVSDFCGFNKMDFETVRKLKNGSIEYDEKDNLRRKLDLLAEKIIQANKQDINLSHYTNKQIGNLQKHDDSRVWLAISRDDFKPLNSNNNKPKYSSLKQCNFTVELDTIQLEINAIIRNGNIKSKKTPIYYFYSNLEQYIPLFNSNDFDLYVYKRVSMITGKVIRAGNEKWVEPKLFKFAELKTESGLNNLKKYLNDIYIPRMCLPGISIRYSINYNNLEQYNAEELLKLITAKELKLKPFLDIIHKAEIINP